jgi:signal transduction histidine kinase
MNDEPRPGPAARAGSLPAALLRLLWAQPIWAIPFALFFGTIYGPSLAMYWHSYKASLVYAYMIGLTITLLEILIMPGLRRRRRFGRLPLALDIALFAVAAVLGSYAAAAILHFTFMPGMLGSTRSVLQSGLYAMVFAVLIGGVLYSFHFYRQSMAQARAVESIRAELAQAELRALRAQIHPHFLFNTLNSIASLIPSNPRAAEEMTTRLADVFRHALRASEREWTPLGDELAFLRDYLGIERVRFGDRLAVEERIAPGLDAVPVPSLILQPLVENAVRHAIAARPAGGRLVIAARAEGDRLLLEVVDDGPGFDPAQLDERAGTGGFGLFAVRERLRAAGFADALAIDSAPGRATCVRVTLPLDPDTTPLAPSPRPQPDGDSRCRT